MFSLSSQHEMTFRALLNRPQPITGHYHRCAQFKMRGPSHLSQRTDEFNVCNQHQHLLISTMPRDHSLTEQVHEETVLWLVRGFVLANMK